MNNTNNKKILITDSLFMKEHHVKMLEEKGYQVERLEKSHASEEELIDALRDKHGYILGGIERVTDRVIESAPLLESIVFTGSDWKYFIPGWCNAEKRGITIANYAPGPQYATAEYTLAAMLSMNRNMSNLTSTGTQTFLTTLSVTDQTIGIIGMGRIAQELVTMLSGLQPKKILYSNRSRNLEMEKLYDVEYVDLDTLAKQSDVVTLHVPIAAGKHLISKEILSMMKDGALLINTSDRGSVDTDALYEELFQRRLRAFYDWPNPDERFESLPSEVWLHSNDHTAFNTSHTIEKSSNAAVESIDALLNKRPNHHQVI